VDWINDKLYWTDRDYKLIEEYNLRTSYRRVVVHTGLLSHPLGIADCASIAAVVGIKP